MGSCVAQSPLDALHDELSDCHPHALALHLPLLNHTVCPTLQVPCLILSISRSNNAFCWTHAVGNVLPCSAAIHLVAAAAAAIHSGTLKAGTFHRYLA
eukprot:1153081-Pelagomonas_calceolata.AAC.7